MKSVECLQKPSRFEFMLKLNIRARARPVVFDLRFAQNGKLCDASMTFTKRCQVKHLPKCRATRVNKLLIF